MASYTTYDSEQLDRVRRIGSKMRQAAPLCSRTVKAPSGAPFTKNPVKGGTPKSSGKKSSGSY